MPCKNRKLKLLILFSLVLLIFQNSIKLYSQLTYSGITVYPNVLLKPNNQHSFYFNSSQTLNSITFPSTDTLQLTKDGYNYTIKCLTNDTVSTLINQWYQISLSTVTVSLTSYSSTTLLNFELVTLENGRPASVVGAESWSYNEALTKLSLSCLDESEVIITFGTSPYDISLWILGNLNVWLGFCGLGMVLIGSVLTVKYAEEHEWRNCLIWLLVIIPIGFALIVGWIFA